MMRAVSHVCICPINRTPGLNEFINLPFTNLNKSTSLMLHSVNLKWSL